jgi:lambda repressor-like predicted transcriptional regulator
MMWMSGISAVFCEARPLTMRAVARAAGVSRSTLYRHFSSPAELQRSLQHEALRLAGREEFPARLKAPLPWAPSSPKTGCPTSPRSWPESCRAW